MWLEWIDKGNAVPVPFNILYGLLYCLMRVLCICCNPCRRCNACQRCKACRRCNACCCQEVRHELLAAAIYWLKHKLMAASQWKRNKLCACFLFKATHTKVMQYNKYEEVLQTLSNSIMVSRKKTSKIKLCYLSFNIVVVLKHFVHERECLVIILTLFDSKCSTIAIIARGRREGLLLYNSLCRRGRLRMKAKPPSGLRYIME